jgi:hypothetical protein
MDVVRERMGRQFLTGALAKTPVDLVRSLGAVQAQDYSGAKWAIGMRVGGATDAAIEADIASGRILRTHVLRPTWHFVLPEDIRWMLALTGPRIAAAMGSYNRKLGLTPAVLRRSSAVIEKALQGGAHLMRTEIAAILKRARLGELNGQKIAHMMMQAELDAIICGGPRRGKQFTYALLDRCAPASAAIDRDEGLSRLATRYFATRGPASAHDFAWWSGLSVGDARRAIQVVGNTLTPTEVNDQPMWFVESARARPPVPAGVVHLLPNYDEYFIGFKDRSSIGKRAGTKPVTGGKALINHILTVEGQIVGGWKRVQRGKGMVIDLALLVPLKRAERVQLDKARARFEAFLASQVVIENARSLDVP